MKWIIALLILSSLINSEKTNMLTLKLKKDLRTKEKTTVIRNRHKACGTDVWPGEITLEN